MHMAVDQARGQRCSLRIDDGVGALKIEIFGLAHGDDLAVFDQHGIASQDRLLHIAAEYQADIADRQLRCAAGSGGSVMGHGNSLSNPENKTTLYDSDVNAAGALEPS